MVFGGLQKNSLIDFPGKISCVLFLSGCNFKCPYCHNPDLAKGRPATSPPLDESWICDFLDSHRGFLDGVVISGGEPTLQEELPALCKEIKQMGYPIKLDTNGSRPKVIESLIDSCLIDYIAMDIKTDPFRYTPFIVKDCNPDHILTSIRLIMDSSLDYEFRTTCVKPIVDEKGIENIAGLIDGANFYVLQRFRPNSVLYPEFFKGPGSKYDEEDLLAFKSIADSWVKECIIR
ncbi:MAG: anaerobic ribonucleoside-triphosphate reductase activating protein [Deltaproteobacteria bacterium]|nr:anaerobic ribonucleoside-triphosphate reductase activating protein [Deltaproteobacteria bacterium]